MPDGVAEMLRHFYFCGWLDFLADCANIALIGANHMTRETELAELVSSAHFMRARARAGAMARTCGQEAFFFRASSGWQVSLDRPFMVSDLWRVDVNSNMERVE